MSKDTYRAGETTILRLPTNAIIDLKTLCLSFDAQITAASGNTFNRVYFPRHNQSLIRRLDVTIGGVQVGLGSLGDYGAAWNLLANNTMPYSKLEELGLLESECLSNGAMIGESVTNYPIATSKAANTKIIRPVDVFGWKPAAVLGRPHRFQTTNDSPGDTLVAGTIRTFAVRKHITQWFGLLEGKFNRFLDTNLLPDVEIRITWASGAVLAQNSTVYSAPTATPGAGIGTDGSTTTTTYAPAVNPFVPATGLSFNTTKIFLHMETIAFGDNSYRAMVESRLGSGGTLTIPYTNLSLFESAASSQSTSTQFTIATQSLDMLMGTLRPVGYDGADQVVPNQTNADANVAERVVTQTTSAFQTPYYNFVSMDPKTSDAEKAGSLVDSRRSLANGPGANTLFSQAYPGGAQFQAIVDGIPYPQYMADTGDCYYLTKKMFDGAGGNVAHLHPFTNFADWAGNAFMMGVSFKHNSVDAVAQRLVSGLNTNSSNVSNPISVVLKNTGNYREKLEGLGIGKDVVVLLGCFCILGCGSLWVLETAEVQQFAVYSNASTPPILAGLVNSSKAGRIASLGRLGVGVLFPMTNAKILPAIVQLVFVDVIHFSWVTGLKSHHVAMNLDLGPRPEGCLYVEGVLRATLAEPGRGWNIIVEQNFAVQFWVYFDFALASVEFIGGPWHEKRWKICLSACVHFACCLNCCNNDLLIRLIGAKTAF